MDGWSTFSVSAGPKDAQKKVDAFYSPILHEFSLFLNGKLVVEMDGQMVTMPRHLFFDYLTERTVTAAGVLMRLRDAGAHADRNDPTTVLIIVINKKGVPHSSNPLSSSPVRIPGFHPGDPGSNPGNGINFLFLLSFFFCVFPFSFYSACCFFIVFLFIFFLLCVRRFLPFR